MLRGNHYRFRGQMESGNIGPSSPNCGTNGVQGVAAERSLGMEVMTAQSSAMHSSRYPTLSDRGSLISFAHLPWFYR